jgi:hypothetical protein
VTLSILQAHSFHFSLFFFHQLQSLAMARFLLPLLLALISALATANPVTIPLRQRHATNVDAFAQTIHAANKHSGGRLGFAIAPETLE